MRVLVTGGCGFIGSNFIKLLLKNSEELDIEKVINLDKITYAGKRRNIEHMGLSTHPKYIFVKGDICDKNIVEKVFSEHSPNFVFNFAAESHVDRSIADSQSFIKTNVIGAGVLLDASIKHNFPKFIQISTDEVYGSLQQHSKSSEETDSLNPRSPYSASKAAAESLVLSYFATHKLPFIITRSSNNYGPYQHPEKLLPLFITNLIQGKKVPLMWSEENPGLNVRDWLHVEDNCRAIWFISQRGKIGEIYNIAGENEKTNIHMTKLLLNNFNQGEDMIEKIQHRQGHDFRYSINMEKLKNLGFRNSRSFIEEEISKLCEWYKQNENWWKSKNTKGIILAGGISTRLYPATISTCKQLIPVYDKPMIYYPISTLILGGIRDILIISTPKDLLRFKELLGDGSKIGMKFSYKEQSEPKGLADAFIIGEEFIGEDNVCLILGDNLFYGHDIPKMLKKTKNQEQGATIFGYHVKDPERYGIVEFDKNDNVLSIEEKPKQPKSNYAVVGLYFYDNKVINIAKNLKPSDRGEIEITDINKIYLEKGNLKVELMGRGVAWLDTGTPTSLIEASIFVKTIQDRQGLQIGCIEEAAYREGLIDKERLREIGESMKSTPYGEYLLQLGK